MNRNRSVQGKRDADRGGESWVAVTMLQNTLETYFWQLWTGEPLTLTVPEVCMARPWFSR